jgi:2-dehydropantoate 2-reductase
VPIEGISRTGNSSLQSLTRNAGSLETAYLNGEIVLLGRSHGVPVPANECFLSLAPQLVADPALAGTFDPDEMLARIGALEPVGQDLRN